ncbi:transcriptional regulator [Streptomyces boninensis]|uniref:transcriptional regulator n=1 Tax=Streptomyces boninensis TaxID=2039455 RepID=UPI003B2160D2
MYDTATRKRALALVAQGRSQNSVSKEMGISRAAIRGWMTRIEPLPRIPQVGACVRCAPDPALPKEPESYAYLLGLYLGDGCISAHPKGGGRYLRIACAQAWPGLVEECKRAIIAVCPDRSVYGVQRHGDVLVSSYGHHWLCLFPQHGPGRKHERRIALESWQHAIVASHPWAFIRGLIHSDGCRITNWTVRTIGGERKRYEYARYFFTNTSADIVRLFTDVLDDLGVEWKPARQKRAAVTISIARRTSVALMDHHVGPKY